MARPLQHNMHSKSLFAGLIACGLSLALASCEFADETFWPGSEEPPAEAQAQDGEVVVIQPSAAEQAAGGQGVASFGPGGGSTGTVVGARVAQLATELRNLQQSINGNGAQLQQLRQRASQNAQVYNDSVSDIRSRLQTGTTPGNPQVIGQWNVAQGQLDAVNSDIGAMTNLAAAINNDVTVSGFLLDAIRSSYTLAGGIDQDHRDLEQLENMTAEALQASDQMQAAINDEIAQQAAYVASERQNLTTLALAIDKGHFLNAPVTGRGFASAGGQQVASVAGRRPLVVIRFDRANVNYENALAGAVSQAVQRFPSARFDLVAVAPAAGSAANQEEARRNAEKVLRSMTGMGISADRITLSATTSPSVADEEVHVYVR